MKVTITKFLAWHATLTELDKMNFNSVVAMRLAEKLPPGPYRDMAEFATALSKKPDLIERFEALQKFLNDVE